MDSKWPIPDEMESLAIVRRKHGVVIYLYPFDYEVAKTGAKVMTKDGKVLRRMKCATEKGAHIVTGEIDGQAVVFDENGHNASMPESDLYIPERYFDPDWKQKKEMTNAEWASQFQRDHSSVDLPEEWK